MRLQVEDRDGDDWELAQMVFNTDVYLNGKMAKYVTVAMKKLDILSATRLTIMIISC